jgi:hypothetical protein
MTRPAINPRGFRDCLLEEMGTNPPTLLNVERTRGGIVRVDWERAPGDRDSMSITEEQAVRLGPEGVARLMKMRRRERIRDLIHDQDHNVKEWG